MATRRHCRFSIILASRLKTSVFCTGGVLSLCSFLGRLKPSASPLPIWSVAYDRIDVVAMVEKTFPRFEKYTHNPHFGRRSCAGVRERLGRAQGDEQALTPGGT